MRRITTPPYCFLETCIPVKHKKYVGMGLKQVTVNEIMRFEQWHPAADLTALLKYYREEFKCSRRGWKVNLREGTVNGVKVRRVESDTWQPDNFSAVELKAPPGYRYWQCDPAAKTVTVTCMWQWERASLEKSRKRWQQVLQDPDYLPPVICPMPDGWVETKPTENSGWLSDRNVKKVMPMERAQHNLVGLLDGTVDWAIEQAFNRPEQDELVPLVFSRRKPRLKNDSERKFWEVTGRHLKDPSKALYRMLHYFGGVKIEDCYKGHVLRIWHPKGVCWADLEFWKYELSARLVVDSGWCTKLKNISCVRAGVPGGNAGELECQAAQMAWFNLLLRLLETKTMIYSGNNFEV